MFRHDVSNFQLSPRFLATLLEGGTGVGLLQRANEEVTRRAHQLWMETGRKDSEANWADAERSLMHWKSFPDAISEGDLSPVKGLENAALDELDLDFAQLSHEDLVHLCCAMQQNLRSMKTAYEEEHNAVKALRKELRDERCRLQNFSYKLKATEDELFRKKAQVDPGKLRVPSLPLDFMKPRAIEHFNLTPRARCRRRAFSCPTDSAPSSDCEACEMDSCFGDGTPCGSWWFSDAVGSWKLEYGDAQWSADETGSHSADESL
ncbi:unnamed protein product [Durusdinium trenchii]|uniref:Uncharacterized protein n=1 Tax=Durusdinium trenchii TaxID=1381693 RepID=A0ABP0NFP4_9DINO